MAPIPSDSLLFTERISQYVSLPPAALASPLPALCASVFSPLLLSYFPPARGIILAYEDVALSSSSPPSPSASAHAAHAEEVLLRHVDEYAAPFLWATATFLVWRPARGSWIEARVAHQSKTHVTLSYLNVFPVSVLAAHLPASWTFEARKEGEGVWVGEEGEVGGELRVRLLDFDGRTDGRARGKGVRIEGSLVSEEEEEKRREKGKGKGWRGGLKGVQAEA